MNNKYISEKESIIEALDEIDVFMTRMLKFVENRPEYEYSVTIHQNTNLRSDKKWVIELNVIKNEETN